MRFLGTVITWIAASAIAYGLAAVFSQTMVLNNLAAMGAEVTVGIRWESTVDAVGGLTAYLAVIAAGFLVAFYIASLVKALIPALSFIAYPVAGAGAIGVALMLMKFQYEVYPIGGVDQPVGFWLQIFAGFIGGVVFEAFRPRD